MTVVDHIAIVGGGIMGGGIGQAFLQHGYEVTINDVDEAAIEETRERIESGNYGLERAVEGGYLSEEQKDEALDRLEFTHDDIGAAVEGTDVVIEAVPEDLSLKGRVFRELDEATDDDVPMLSNTSGFSIAAMAAGVEDPSRVAGAHFFNPAQIMNLVEIVETPQTDQEVVSLAEELFADIDKKTITIPDVPKEYGFVVNRIWGAMREEARKVVREGVATEEEVNLAMREGRNLPVGPLEGASIGEEWD
jgi:3-hydroxybutyryl-CoA dehydrogenase